MKALLFNVDGTLYDQPRLRRWMLQRLIRCYWSQPVEGLAAVRILQAYRRGQEHLRASSETEGNPGEEQLQFACRQSGGRADVVRACVARWMEREPLAFLPRAIRPDAVNALRLAKQRGLLLGVVSDYPADAKLKALGIGDLFDIVVCAEDANVQRFKPNPRGIEVALHRLGVSRDQAVYVGDRIDVDAAAAFNAGVRCIIVDGKGSHHRCNVWRMPDFAALASAIARDFRR